MTRMARAVAVGLPHHVTQRGNRKMRVFFSDDDYLLYQGFLAELCAKSGVEIWAYCLMPNHVHFIAVPWKEDALRKAFGEAHRRYSKRINEREDWRGHLWQERFYSFIMDWPHLVAAARYIELNPVRAGLAKNPDEWKWSSALAHIEGRDDILVREKALKAQITPDWRKFLSEPEDEETSAIIRLHQRTGRPLGSMQFVEHLEQTLGRKLTPGKSGRPEVNPEINR